MSANKPNIIECDGIIIRGPSGRKRAEIVVDETRTWGAMVLLHLYGDADLDVPEPALTLSVDGAGQAGFRLGFAGAGEDGKLENRPTLRATSGGAESLPRIEYYGRRDRYYGAPTFVLDGETLGRNSDFVTAMVEAAREYSSRFGTVEEDPIELMDEVAAVLQHEQETAG